MADQQGRHDNPAADAAGLLLRIGFAVLVLAAPFAALFSRRAFVVLVPVGALLILVAALVKDPRAYVQKFRDVLLSPVGLIVVAFCTWMVMSLAWTPFPATAAERAFRTLGNAFMAVAVCTALPERMRSSNLNLMSLGIALATVALVLGALVGSGLLNMFSMEGPMFSRAAIAAGVLVWPALAWTITRGRDMEGLLLIAACGIAAIASTSTAAAVVLFAALLVFLLVRTNIASAKVLSLLWAAVIVLAPALALLARFVSTQLMLAPGHLITQAGLWADVIAQQPVRLLTGHGFDTLQRARSAGLVGSEAPLGLLPELWYDLGALGAVGLAAAVFLAMRQLARAPTPIAAASLAVVSAILLFLIIDSTATQQWWLSITVVAAITMTAVHHGQYRTRRPRASFAGIRIGSGQAG
jgi:hypothetical protein